jgi:hypothetical protein
MLRFLALILALNFVFLSFFSLSEANAMAPRLSEIGRALGRSADIREIKTELYEITQEQKRIDESSLPNQSQYMRLQRIKWELEKISFQKVVLYSTEKTSVIKLETLFNKEKGGADQLLTDLDKQIDEALARQGVVLSQLSSSSVQESVSRRKRETIELYRSLLLPVFKCADSVRLEFLFEEKRGWVNCNPFEFPVSRIYESLKEMWIKEQMNTLIAFRPFSLFFSDNPQSEALLNFRATSRVQRVNGTVAFDSMVDGFRDLSQTFDVPGNSFLMKLGIQKIRCENSSDCSVLIDYSDL